tara:strand:- start:47333 stop:48076 length:744 start_codon:yes stop_codon:yes gene_type:complete
MYSWGTIRAACILLLLLPLLHLTYLMARDTLALLDTSPEAWQRELDGYIAQDEKTPLPEAPVVVVGGRRVKLWQGLAQILAPEPVLMRGLGDAIVEDISYHYPRLVAFYRPSAVVLFPGDSEFAIRDSKSAPELVEAITELLEIDTAQGLEQRFVIVSPVKTPAPGSFNSTIDAALPLLGQLAAREARVSLLDVNPVLTGVDGAPDPGLFRGDGIQLNEQGYLRLSLVLRNHLWGDTGPTQEVTALR